MIRAVEMQAMQSISTTYIPLYTLQFKAHLCQGANIPGTNPMEPKKASNKKAKLNLPWEVQSFYSEQVPERDDEEENEEEEEQHEATLARLAAADERTKNMTRGVRHLVRLPPSILHLPQGQAVPRVGRVRRRHRQQAE